MALGGDLGIWAVRFLAAAGVSSLGCSTSSSGSPGTAGSGGAAEAGAGSGSVNVAGAGTGAGGSVAGAGGSAAGVGGAGGSSAGAGAGGSGGSAGAGVTAGSSSGGQPHVGNESCLNPAPFGGPDTGFERCENGVVRRPRLGTCATAASSLGCLADADCTEPDSICACDADNKGTCVRAKCSTSDDCESGQDCIGTADYCTLFPFRFACDAPTDGCSQDADCVAAGGAPSVNNRCVINAAGSPGVVTSRSCNVCGVAGRPFLVDTTARTAPTRSSAAWLRENLAPLLPPSSADERAVLVAHWQRSAELEHASVAAFARFVLELLSVGAPAALVDAATRAQADEIGHARACYSVASAYAGRALGPDRLNVKAALDDGELPGIVRRAVIEGCVGETIAAIEAGEAARGCLDPAVRSLLETISEEEARHAELSWCFLRWALNSPGAALHGEVRDTLARIGDELAASAEASTEGDEDLRDHGVLPGAERAALALRAFREVVRPCADGLLDARKVTTTDVREVLENLS